MKTTWRKAAIVAVPVAAAIVILAWLALPDEKPSADPSGKDRTAERPKTGEVAGKAGKKAIEQVEKKAVRQAAKDDGASTNATARVKRRIPYVPRMSEAAEKELEAFKDELSDKGYAAARHLALKILSGGEPEAKKDCIEQLKICGSDETLPDIVTCLADDDEEVRIAANDAVDFCLQQIDDDDVKILAIKSIVSVKGALNSDSLNLIVGQLNAMQNQGAVAEMALGVIEKAPGSAVEEAMKEAFEFAMDEKFTTIEAAHELINSRKAGGGGGSSEE